eukprot:TRINITY_DN109484_c0_g1_i1.p1 TRINITY_DN109484_c0_g1~~TRINITY_DN109484_c0_g1_i1.p1  ORF type:complete len:343 (+),score=52.38 TRINITY_DN109484_c0_g1_i1:131-1159(+)
MDVFERQVSARSITSDTARGGLEAYADIWPPKIPEVPEVQPPPTPAGRPQKTGGRPGSRGRRKRAPKAAQPPEEWQEMLDQVEPPPPPEVCGGVRVKAGRAHEGSDSALPHSEEIHVAEWTIRHLQVDLKLLKVKYKSVFVPAGQYITSHHFRIAGADAYLRFWPNGFYGASTKKERLRMDLGGLRADSWCALALCMPIDTKLRLRFRVGQIRSEMRECQWEATGSVIQQVWMPPEQEPPDLTDLVVGVEVYQNFQVKPLPGPVRSSLWIPSPRHYQLPAVDEDPMRGQISTKHKMVEHLKDGVKTLQLMRLGQNLALPSPRYGNCAEELWRRPPRCHMRAA